MSTESAPFRYRAFISYSHRDWVFSRRLHRRLERYRPPRGAFGAAPPGDKWSTRIKPVFRDQEELASSDNLSASIQEALDGSEILIVLCSPASAKSRWVNEEIRYFREKFPERKVYPIVVDGDPGADPRKQPDVASFPLMMLLADTNDPEGPYREPLAADARKEGDGFSIAFLKLAAGILEVPFDRLRQRDLRRRQQRMALGLLASTALSLTFAIMAWRAIVARNEAREARAQAELELLSEQQTRAFLLSVFRLADPGEARGNSVTVREVLDRAVARIDSAEFARPAIRSRFLATMGQAYSSLGINFRSVELLEESLDALPASSASPEDWRQGVQSRLELADVWFDMGEYDKALLILDAAERTDRHGPLPPEQAARAANIRGDVYSYLEQDNEAMGQYQQALAVVESASLGPESTAAIRHRALGGIAILHYFDGDYETAQGELARVVDIVVPAFGEMHPDSIWALTTWGSAAYENGDIDAARKAWTRSLEISIRVLGETHPEVGTIKNNLARLYLETGDYAQAEDLLRASLAIDRAQRSENFDDLAYPLNNLALVRMARGDFVEARALLEEARSISEAARHRMLGPVLASLADIECEEGRPEAGSSLVSRAVQLTVGEFGPEDWHTQHAVLVRSWCDALRGADVDAVRSQAASAALSRHWGEDSWFTRRAWQQQAFINQQRVESAQPSGGGK